MHTAICTRAHTEGDVQRQKIISPRNEKEVIIINLTNIKKIMGEFYKQLCDIGSLVEMAKF